MTHDREDEDVVRAVVAAAGSPIVSAAFERLVASARKYEWALPILTGLDTELANHRTALLATGMLCGRDGDDLITWAMEQTP